MVRIIRLAGEDLLRRWNVALRLAPTLIVTSLNFDRESISLNVFFKDDYGGFSSNVGTLDDIKFADEDGDDDDEEDDGRDYANGNLRSFGQFLTI